MTDCVFNVLPVPGSFGIKIIIEGFFFFFMGHIFQYRIFFVLIINFGADIYCFCA